MLHVFRIEDSEAAFWYVSESPEEAEGMYKNDPEICETSNPAITQKPDEGKCLVLFRKEGEPWIIAESESEFSKWVDEFKGAVIITWRELVERGGRGYFSSTLS